MRRWASKAGDRARRDRFLRARCRALLRRREQYADPVLRCGGIELDRMERRVRDARVVEGLSNIDYKLDTKADFQDKGNLEPVLAALTAAKVTARIESEEAHEADCRKKVLRGDFRS